AADVAIVPASLRVTGATMAGDPPGPEVLTGEAVRVMTGAPLPPGADTVVIIEVTRPAPDGVLVDEAPERGQFVRPAGDDVRSGDLVFQPGCVLGPGHLGIITSLGRTRVVVHPRPRVGVLSTGDELRTGSGPLSEGSIRDANRATLSAVLAQSGFLPVDLGVVGDDELAVAEAVSAAGATCDAVVTTGGVSVGDRDVMKPVLARLAGPAARSFGVAVKPAKPFAFAELPGACPVFALPGNPVSALVSFELFARPALRMMAGHTSLHRPSALAVTDAPLARRPDGKVHLLRVRARIAPEGRVHVTSAGEQGSHQLSVMATADALAVVPDGNGVPAGGEVEVVLLGSELASGTPPELAASCFASAAPTGDAGRPWVGEAGAAGAAGEALAAREAGV
ncbi:MAG TPA: gephyrin-like molybdotransferase Glp, partial [Acidimicrobiales bacterium]|nr:gephyrin-like molybdotransferase Glp [Acidimicrobiales bacterium]